MNNQAIVMALGEDEDLYARLKFDLALLDYFIVSGKYPDVDIKAIAKRVPDIILLFMTVWDDDTLSAAEQLSKEDALPYGTGLIALVSENTMGKIPFDFAFADIVVVPYNTAELDFRLRRVLHHHRRKADNNNIIYVDDLAISLDTYEVTLKGEPVLFSLKEYMLFKYLIVHPGRVFTRETLLNHVWEHDYLGGIRTVDVHIRRIRAKIGDINESYIKTIRGVGYAFRSLDEQLTE